MNVTDEEFKAALKVVAAGYAQNVSQQLLEAGEIPTSRAILEAFGNGEFSPALYDQVLGAMMELLGIEGIK